MNNLKTLQQLLFAGLLSKLRGADNTNSVAQNFHEQTRSQRFVVVTAVRPAPFSSHLQADGRDAWILILFGRERSSCSEPSCMLQP